MAVTLVGDEESQTHLTGNNVNSPMWRTAEHIPEPDAPARSKRVIAQAFLEKRNFVTTRTPQDRPRNNPNDHLKPKYVPEGKIQGKTQGPKITAVEPKRKAPEKKPGPQHSIQAAQATKLANQDTSNRAQKIRASDQEFKCPMQKVSPKNTNSLANKKAKPLTQTANLSASKSKPPTLETYITAQKTECRKDGSSSQEKKNDANNVAVAENSKNKAEENNINKPNNKPVPETKAQQKTKTPVAETKTEASTQDAKEPIDKSQQDGKPAVEVSSCENRELDPVLGQALEEELQDIMIQVWQELPDDPEGEENKIAVDKLRNEIGDDLRRVLGLNITKRILNVFNNLFVKMYFTCRPQMGCLTSFLNSYNIKHFKRIHKTSNTFAAQMMSIEDFDKLCANKELMCGEAKVTVTPCYKFTKCPENLITIYDDISYYDDSGHDHNESPKKNKMTNDERKVDVKTKENVAKMVKKIGNTALNSDDKAAEIIKKPDVPKDVNINETMLNVKKDDSKKIIKDDKISKTISKNVTGKESKKICKTDAAVKLDIDGSRMEVPDDRYDDENDDLEMEIPENQMDGDEELDDEDILALMSEGIVLDECSGSDDEK